MVHEHEQQQTEASGGTEQTYTPAYVPFPTLESFLDSLDPAAVPRRIDRSMMLSLSGGVQRKLMSALAFLHLIKPGGETTDRLREFVKSKGNPDERKAVLAGILDAAYAKVLNDLDIGTATAKQFVDVFRKAVGEGSATTISESVRFYVKARKAAGLPISPYIAAAKLGAQSAKSSNGNGARQAPKRTATGSDGASDAQPKVEATPPKEGAYQPPAGTIPYPLYFRGKPQGCLIVPVGLTQEDVKVIELMIPVLRAYAGGPAQEGGG